jgi:hypothetical protein
MSILTALFDVLAGMFRFRQAVRGHKKRQAYGPRWSKRRTRTINRYKRRRPR